LRVSVLKHTWAANATFWTNRIHPLQVWLLTPAALFLFAWYAITDYFAVRIAGRILGADLPANRLLRGVGTGAVLRAYGSLFVAAVRPNCPGGLFVTDGQTVRAGGRGGPFRRAIITFIDVALCADLDEPTILGSYPSRPHTQPERETPRTSRRRKGQAATLSFPSSVSSLVAVANCKLITPKTAFSNRPRSRQ